MKYKLLLLIHNSCALVNPIHLTHRSFEPHETFIIYLFIYLYLILACNRKVMAEATDYGTLSSARVLRLLLAGIRPRAVFRVRVVVPFLLFGPLSCCRRLVQEPCLLGGHHTGSFPPFLHPSPPIFKPFFHLYFLHKAK
jgi:hypothetical protein